MTKADDDCLKRYRALQIRHPDWFDNTPDCPIRILLDSSEIRHAQRAVRIERAAQRLSTDDLRVGLLAEDHYIGAVVRDAVMFSDGRYGLYNRVIASGGVAVLPILPDGIALIHIFRHPPRRWFLEAPQGLLLPGANPAEQAQRELMEEMGAEASDVVPLGVVYTSTAMTSECLKLFAARIAGVGEPQREEGIDSIRVIPKADIDQFILDGSICDGSTTTLITRSRLRGLL